MDRSKLAEDDFEYEEGYLEFPADIVKKDFLVFIEKMLPQRAKAWEVVLQRVSQNKKFNGNLKAVQKVINLRVAEYRKTE